MNAPHADFGFSRVTPDEKTARVGRVFSSVAGRYDLMNDLMSFGIHRLWKRFAVHLAGVREGDRVLDLAGGTGDCSALLQARVGASGLVVMSDINAAMLRAGRERLLNRGHARRVACAQADAGQLPFGRNSFDRVLMAFGLRNVTDKAAALRGMVELLKFGGAAVILEFSVLRLEALRPLYDWYSFECIPRLGEQVAGDRDSYSYLVESIRMHPDPESLKSMMEGAGFSQVGYHCLSGGIVAVHRGYKL